MPLEVITGEDGESAEIEITGEQSDPDALFRNTAPRMVYQSNNFFLPQIHGMINNREVINLRPEYQRRLRWSTLQKSRLVESFLLNIPVPPIFLYENRAARYEVMDGQQRLNSIQEFLSGEFALTNLTVLQFLNGYHYSRLSSRIKRTLDRASLSAIVLLLESRPVNTSQGLTLTDMHRFIFDRVNTGGTKLNSQEIRNAMNPGCFNDMLIDITRLPIFTKVFGIPPYENENPKTYYENSDRKENRLYSSMQDCELALRYFALKDKPNIRGSMKSMLDRAMMKKISTKEKEEWRLEYEERLKFLYKLFNRRPFLLPPKRGRRRGQLSAAIYDASMVAINNLWESRHKISIDKGGVRERMQKALGEEDTLTILTGRKNTAESIRNRVELMRMVFLGQ